VVEEGTEAPYRQPPRVGTTATTLRKTQPDPAMTMNSDKPMTVSELKRVLFEFQKVPQKSSRKDGVLSLLSFDKHGMEVYRYESNGTGGRVFFKPLDELVDSDLVEISSALPEGWRRQFGLSG